MTISQTNHTPVVTLRPVDTGGWNLTVKDGDGKATRATFWYRERLSALEYAQSAGYTVSGVKTVEAYGESASGKPWRKTFASLDALQVWTEKTGAVVVGVRDLEPRER